MKNDKHARLIVEKGVDRSNAWAYFDWDSKKNSQMSGARGILHFRESHILKFKAGLGRGTNNYVELMALKLILCLASERGVQKIQFF
jgi:ribonuclease HI